MKISHLYLSYYSVKKYLEEMESVRDSIKEEKEEMPVATLMFLKSKAVLLVHGCHAFPDESEAVESTYMERLGRLRYQASSLTTLQLQLIKIVAIIKSTKLYISQLCLLCFGEKCVFL